MNSIRRYLLKWLFVALFVGTALIAVAIYLNTKHETDELFDEHLRQMGRAVLAEQDALFSPQNNNPPALSLNRKLKGEEEFLIQIWDQANKLNYSSHPNVELPLFNAAKVSAVEFNGRHWKTFSISSSKWNVQISQPNAARREMISEIGMNNLIPIIVQIPLLGLLFWIVIGRSLEPLEAVSQSIRTKVPGTLSLVSDNALPLEIKPVVTELNNLMTREHDVLERQRQFTSDAAHELRTPLAAIQLQADVLARSTTTEEKQQASTSLRAGIERAAYLINQLLTLARTEKLGLAALQPTNIPALIELILDRNTGAINSKQLTVILNLDDTLIANVDKDSFETALSSLIDNAIRYNKQHGAISISANRTVNCAMITISDTGCGITEIELPRVFERFYRVAGTNVDGTGLGLPIAKSIIEQQHGTIELASNAPKPGLNVTIRLS